MRFVAFLLAKLCLPMALLWQAGPAAAITLHVSLDTHAPAAAGLVLAFDFIDGGPPGNQGAVTHFSSDGTAGAASFAGDAGLLPGGGFRFGDAGFFNEVLLPLAGATRMAFDLEVSTVAPAPGSLADAFSFYLLDATTQLPWFDTSDPTGANALFTVQAGGPLAPLSVFAATSSGQRWTVTEAAGVPEPGTLALAALGLLALVLRRRSAWAAVAPLLMAFGAAQAAIHVMPGGGTTFPHDGAKWDSAYSATELQTTLDKNPGAEFWLAKGGYGAVRVPDATQLYGGFVGGPLGEASRGERNPKANFTSIDGVLMAPYDDGNGNTVVPGPATVVDGFFIGGFGFLLEQASPTLSNNVISGAPTGIDLRFGAAPTVTDSQITGSSIGVSVAGPAQSKKVGGKQVELQPSFIRSTISGVRRPGVPSDAGIGLNENTAPGALPTLIVQASTFSDSPAGAMFLFGNARISDCIVEHNGSDTLLNGAVTIGPNGPGQRIVIDRCKIRDNIGTGLHAAPSAGSTVILSNSEVTGNKASNPSTVPHPGGVAMSGLGQLQIAATRITGNRTNSAGGGVYFFNIPKTGATALIVDSLIAGNQAGVHGGGIAAGSAPFTVLNSTIAGNSAPAGGGVWLDDIGAVSLINTAITDNSAPLASAVAYEPLGATPASLFQNVATLATDSFASSLNGLPRPRPAGPGNLTIATAGYAGPADYRLSATSPLIDRGDGAPINAYIASGGLGTDLAGAPRIAGTAVDIGAYERPAPGVADVTALVALKLGGLSYDRAARRYVQLATLTNTSASTIPGPLSLVCDGLPGGVVLIGSNGVTAALPPAGSPYLDVLAGDLAPGTLMTLTLRFDDPLGIAVRYTPRVLAGAGPR